MRLLTLCLACGLMAAPLRAHDGAKFEPADGKVLHGIGQCGGAGEGIETANQYALALKASSGTDALHPVITKRYYSMYERNSHRFATGQISFPAMLSNKLGPIAIWLNTHATGGMMPEISIGFGVYQGIWADQMIPQGDMDVEIRALAKVIKSYGQPCFVRPGYEPNTLKYNAFGAYRDSYRHIVDLFRDEGVENVAWVWCSGPVNGIQMATIDPLNGPWWYPGDGYVDWIGVDVFKRQNFDPSLGHSSFNSFDAMLKLADAWKKPVFVSETSALLMDNGDWGIQDTSLGGAMYYWDAWFGPFFKTLEEHPRIKAWAYINWDWEPTPWAWPNARIQDNPYLIGMLAAELSKPRYIHRATPGRFPHPYLLHVGRTIEEGTMMRLAGANADPSGSGLPAVVAYFVSLQKPAGAPTPGFLDQKLGFLSSVGQYWFLGPAYYTAGVGMSDSNGDFEIQVPVPVGTAGFSVHYQAVVSDPVGGQISLTQPMDLEIETISWSN